LNKQTFFYWGFKNLESEKVVNIVLWNFAKVLKTSTVK